MIGLDCGVDFWFCCCVLFFFSSCRFSSFLHLSRKNEVTSSAFHLGLVSFHLQSTACLDPMVCSKKSYHASSQCLKHAQRTMHVSTSVTDQNLISNIWFDLKWSKYLKFIVANTQQVCTQEKLHAEDIIILMKYRARFRKKVAWFRQQGAASNSVLANKNKQNKGELGGQLLGQLVGGCVHRHTLPAPEWCRGWAIQTRAVWPWRGTRLLPPRKLISVLLVREAADVSKISLNFCLWYCSFTEPSLLGLFTFN